MREVIAGLEDGSERCQLAFDAYVHRLAAATAAMAAAMGGLDALFTGGVGENSAPVRAAACAAVAFLGVELDHIANATAAGDLVLSPRGAATAVVALPAREDLEIARQVRAPLS